MGSMFIVTGSGRSGTSAVARVLHESGIYMGQKLFLATQYNPKGYYEDRAVRELNDSILADCGISPSKTLLARMRRRLRRMFGATQLPALQRMAGRTEIVAAGARHGKEMARLAAGLPSPGGWKDPNFSWTLEAWLPYLPEKPRLVICLRSPDAVASSVMRVHGLIDTEAAGDVASPEYERMLNYLGQLQEATGRLWAEQYERLLQFVNDFELEATCVEYDALIKDPENVVSDLSAFVDHPLDPKHVEMSLQHYEAGVPERFAQLYQRVAALSKRPTAPAG